jgi:hypothetical protein
MSLSRPLILVVAVLLAVAAPAFAGDTYVKGYIKKDGTYVAPYHRTTPNSTTSDNYSTYPTINPWTGQQGTRQPEPYNAQPMQPVQPFGAQPRSRNPWGR